MLIRKALTPGDLQEVWRLTHDQYVRMGYAEPQPGGMLRHYHLDGIPETIVWVAEEDDGSIVGTVSLTYDNPAGLHVDEDFRDVADEVRAECLLMGWRLAASWRIATRQNLRNELSVSMALVAAIVEEILARPIHVTLYTFNPRHEGFYRRMCGLETIAGPRPSRSVQNAPGILMRGDLSRVAAVWQRTKARRSSARIAPVAVAAAGTC